MRVVGPVTVAVTPPSSVWTRALSATVLIMGGSTMAHSLAGGHVPGLAGLLILGVVVFGASVVVLGRHARRDLALPVALVLVGASQAALHGAFGLLGSMPPGHAGHAAHASGVADQAASAMTYEWSWQMLGAHLASSIITVAVWWLCDRAVRSVLVVLAMLGVVTPRRSSLAGPQVPAVLSLVHLVAAPRRGPPVAA